MVAIVTTFSLRRKWRQWRRQRVKIFFRGDVQNITYNDEEADERTATGAGNSGESRDSVRADNDQPKSGSKDVHNIALNVIF